MGPQLAVVVVATWQWILLIGLCFGSLIIGLYCLLFTVPLKSFVERINSLGGGMKGIRAHVDGVRNETEKSIAAAQQHAEEQLTEAQSDVRGAIDSVAETARGAHEGVQRLDRAAQGLQAAVRANSCDARSLSATLTGVQKELAELKSDLEALHAELRGSVDQMVSDSYQRLEGTVLSALEALKDEMLRGIPTPRPTRESGLVPARSGPASPRGPRSGTARPGTSNKIIEGAPLFAGLDKRKGDSAQRGDDGGETRHSKEQPAPAK